MDEVNNFVAELEKLSKNIVSSAPPQPANPVPQEEPKNQPAPATLKPKPTRNTSSTPTSFDGIIEKALKRQMFQVDEEAAAKKKRIEENFWDRLNLLMDSIANDSQPQIQIQPPPQLLQSASTPQQLKPLPNKMLFHPKTAENRNLKNPFRMGDHPKFLSFIVALLMIVALAVGIGVGNSAPVSTQNVGATGFIYTVGTGVYADKACTLNVSSVSWGTLYPGGSETKTAYIKNTASANQSLLLIVDSWIPAAASKYLSLSWNCTDYVLVPMQVVAANFTLTASPEAQGGNFAFNIRINGIGV